MKHPQSLMLVLVGALVGGTLVGLGSSSLHVQTTQPASPVVPLDLAAKPDAVQADLSPAPPPSRRPLGELGTGPGDRQALDQTPVFSAALLKLAHENILRGWAFGRQDQPSEQEVGLGMAQFREQVPQLATAIGRKLAKRRTELELAIEDARTGGVFATLDRLEEGVAGPLSELVMDREMFDRFFVSEPSGTALDGVRTLSNPKRNEPVPDGSILTFPAGVFTIEDFGNYWREHFPRDLTLRGAGKNATLLVLESDLSAHDVVRNMTFEDFSLFADNNSLFDIRQTPMSLTMRRVRVMGWDSGAGGSTAFGTEGLALRATDCDFMGGYGRSPERSFLFGIRHNGLLARFDNCSISRTHAFQYIRPGATILFSHCRLEEIFDQAGQVPENVTLDSTTVTHWDSSAGQSLARDLNDLFPDWKARL